MMGYSNQGILDIYCFVLVNQGNEANSSYVPKVKTLRVDLLLDTTDSAEDDCSVTTIDRIHRLLNAIDSGGGGSDEFDSQTETWIRNRSCVMNLIVRRGKESEVFRYISMPRPHYELNFPP